MLAQIKEEERRFTSNIPQLQMHSGIPSPLNGLEGEINTNCTFVGF